MGGAIKLEQVVELVYCLCGELMKKEAIDSGIPVCWKCQCNSNEELVAKIARKKKIRN